MSDFEQNLSHQVLGAPTAAPTQNRRAIYGLIAAAFVMVLAILGYIYTQVYLPSVQSDADIPLITASKKPVKILPDQPGGMEIPNQDRLIFEELLQKSEGKKPKTTRIVPQPEEPIQPVVQSVAAPSVSQAATKPKLVTPPKKEPAPKVEVIRSVVKKPKPAPKKPPVKLAPAKLTVIKPTPKHFYVQVASLRQERQARTTGEALRRRFSHLFIDMVPTITPVEIKNKGTMYRVQFGGYASRQAATQACHKLKAKKQGCFVIKK